MTGKRSRLRAAERRQVDPDQSTGAAGGRDRLALCRDDRDAIEVQLDLDDYPVTVIETAGIRET